MPLLRWVYWRTQLELRAEGCLDRSGQTPEKFRELLCSRKWYRFASVLGKCPRAESNQGRRVGHLQEQGGNIKERTFTIFLLKAHFRILKSNLCRLMLNRDNASSAKVLSLRRVKNMDLPMLSAPATNICTKIQI